ncbi:MAG TPA: alpha/beta hydrolase [Verrucomicrobiae bacterium]|nr:alpha/beta hydrolase [Verrucomicrobiae bacterium]
MIENRASAPAKELIVLVHGFTGGAESMVGVRDAVREIKPAADIVLFDYGKHPFSNGDLFRIAQEIDDKMEEFQASRNYSEIMLLGYSIGALLLRKAYVYGCGNIADAPTAGGDQAVSRPPRQWVRQVKRFVLLAGMNRGWARERRTSYSSSRSAALIHAAWWMAKLTGTGLLIRQALCGEPFVANLRLQWLEAMRDADARGTPRPQVLQLLGDRDDVVTKDDSRDLSVARDFIWVTVNNTTHDNTVRLGNGGTGLERKRKIQLAFGDDESIEKLRRTNPIVTRDEDPDVKTVVFVLHGIRDMGEWTSNFEAPLQKAYHDTRPLGDKLHIHRASYGFLAMGPFLIWADRQKNVRWFMDQVTELAARFPNLKEIHFIGHSNGTYVLASALQKYQTLKVGYAVLAGSVIRKDYPWSKFTGRIKQVRNYVGSKDLVVGFFPRLFELPFASAINADIGSAGFNGFDDSFGNSMETRFVRGTHAAALVEDNIPSIVEFIIHGRKIDIETVLTRDRPSALQLLSNACWIVWLGLLGLIVSVAGFLAWIAIVLSHHLTWLPTPVALAVFLGGYFLFIWYLLLTV